MTTKREIKQYMKANIQNSIDPQTGELSMTALAEQAAAVLNLYGQHHEIQSRVFETAFEVTEAYEKASALAHGGSK